MERYRPYAFSFFAGILFALGYPSFVSESLLVTPIIGMIILFHFIFKSYTLKDKIIHLILFNLAFNYMGFYWITNTLQEFGELPFIVASILSGLFTFIITPHLWVAVFLIHFIFESVQTDQFNSLFGFPGQLRLTNTSYIQKTKPKKPE